MPEKPAKLSYPRFDDPRYRITLTQQMASSSVGALITSFMVTPLDVVKVRLQAQQKNLISNKCFLYCNGLMDHICPCWNAPGQGPLTAEMLTRQTYFKGTVDAFVKIARNEGMGSLWSGLSPTLVLALPATVVYFVSYEQLRQIIKDKHKGILPVWGPLAAGTLARMGSVTLVSPLELIRTKMQSKRVSYNEIGNAVNNMIEHQGLKGLWRGLGSTLLRDVPFSAIYWFNYETIKETLSHGKPPTFGVSFFAGAVAGSVAAFFTTPFDVVKTHQQIDLGEKEIFSDPPKKGSSLTTVLKRIYHQNGIRGLFAGVVPRLVRVAPACAIMISTFEYSKMFFVRAAMLKATGSERNDVFKQFPENADSSSSSERAVPLKNPPCDKSE